MTYLIFQLYGPLASWGDVAVGERRPTAAQPSRSAVLGLLGSALGVRREDGSRLGALERDLGVAFRVEEPGHLLTDYQTAQVSSQRKGRAPKTRIEELDSEELNTILSTRDYRCDALAYACVWNRTPEVTWSLEQLAEALRRPTFVTYLGRKACVPALPFRPVLVDAPDPVTALRSATPDRVFLNGLPSGRTRSYHWEGAPAEASQSVVRRDRMVSRSRWQFEAREEHMLVEERDRVPEQDPAST